MEKQVYGREVDGDSDDEYTYVSCPVGLAGVARGRRVSYKHVEKFPRGRTS